MPNPVLPSAICDGVPSPTALICDKLRSFFRLANAMCQFWNWAFTTSGEATDAFAALFTRIGVPVGGLLDFPIGRNIPVGYLACNGQSVSRIVYANLFSVIGSDHGAGDGITTFNVPDYAGYYRVGASAMVAAGKVAFGNLAGTVSLTEANNGAHTHRGVALAQGPNAYNTIWGSSPDGTKTGKVYASDDALSQAIATAENPIATTLETSGSGTAFSILPPTKAVVVLIKY